jgi:hypothetical protein
VEIRGWAGVQRSTIVSDRWSSNGYDVAELTVKQKSSNRNQLADWRRGESKGKKWSCWDLGGKVD